MTNKGESWRKLKTVDSALEVINALAELDGAGVTELSNHTGISKSSTYTQLATLREAGFLTKEDNEYNLSYQFLLLGEYVRNNALIFQHGRSKAEELASETGHHVHLFVEEEGLGVNVYEVRGELAGDYEYQSTKLQHREPLHITASGKAILAHLPEDRVDETVEEHGLQSYTANTITSKKDLHYELEAIQEQGFALNDEEEIEGFRAIAAPIITSREGVVGSISLAGPTTYLNGEQFNKMLPEQVMKIANMIQVEINMTR
jgi:DNA-binding IclR family transcriptional regulator